MTKTARGIVAAAVCVVIILILVWFLTRPAAPTNAEVAGERGRTVQISGTSTPTETRTDTRPAAPSDSPEPTPPAASAIALQTEKTSEEPAPAPAVKEPTPFSLPPRANAGVLSSSREIAVVDVARVLEAHAPASETKEARAAAVEEIQRAVAVLAEAHRFGLVLDSSGTSLNGVPILSSGERAYDLTEEVIQQLNQ